jgi:RNA polymerase sigma-70 factor (ECF subfamily)
VLTSVISSLSSIGSVGSVGCIDTVCFGNGTVPGRRISARDLACHHARVSTSVMDRARAGDEDAFRELTGPYLRELHLHCYRMLGSIVDAEDLLQETLVAAWSGLDRFAGRSSLRTWLYRIATNRCLNAIRDRKRRAPPEPVPPFDPPPPTRRGDVTWLQPYPDNWVEELADVSPGPAARFQNREAVELAFVVALQRLPPRQTAALVLRDVLGFSTTEVGAMLDTSPMAVKGALQRARASLAHQLGHAANGAAAAARRPDEEQKLAERFAEALTSDDTDAVVALLTDDAWLAMPPAPHEYQGREAVSSFLRTSAAGREGRPVQLVPTRANTQPAFGWYVTSSDGSAHPAGVIVLTVSGDRIKTITRFLDPSLPAVFGLPDALD